MSILNKTIKETSELLRARKIGVVELTREYIKKIEKDNENINCYITVCEKEALDAA